VSAVDKLLELAGPQAPEIDQAGLMVLSARIALTEVRAYLADSGDDDDEDDKGGNDHSSHGTFKALTKRGMDPKRAAAMCAKADKRVKAAHQIEAALAALGSLEAPEHPAAVAAAKEFGLSAVSSNAADDDKLAGAVLLELSALTAEERRQAQKAAGGFGLEAAADVFALAKPVGDGGIIMNHGPYTGEHEHGHFQSQVHGHPHKHFGDNSHEGGPAHRPGSKPGGRAGW
jgi:hypothetical protein